MKKLLPVLLLAFNLGTFGQTRDLTRWVNPFMGTGGHGHTFPGAAVPFGMVQLSPDTRIDNWDGSSGYHYSDDVIYGFSHTHLSGTGIPDGADILLMPEVDGPRFFRWPGEATKEGQGAKFSHAEERSEPGYYSVRLEDRVFAELTATNRVGLHRYTFPKASPPFVNITLNLKWRDKPLDAQIKVSGDNRIEGFRRSSSWAKNQTVYFVAEFSRPFAGICGTTGMSTAEIDELCKYKIGLTFDSKDQMEVLVKVAISYVSIEGARKNLEAELPHWDFDKVRAEAKAAWNKELSKIEVTGGTDDQRTNFYTALYHTMIHPNVFNDVDGKYLGHDKKVHVLSPGFSRPLASGKPPEGGTPNMPPKGGTQNGEHYTVFSLWDTFRAAHPLYTIIDQKRTVDFINTFIRIYEQGGRLPVWELWGEETDTMIGYHAVSVIADAMAKGIKGFDYEKAYQAAKHSAELDHHGLAAYKKRGYVSGEDDNESVSKTLEYAYNDWCIMSMGAQLFNTRSFATGKNPRNDKYLKDLSAEIEYYKQRAGNFENLFDTETRFFRPKRNGGFIKPFAPEEVTFHFTEGNSWQYSFFVPHDVSRLIQLMGGTAKFVDKLDELFTTKAKLSGREQPDITGLMGQYAHGNEPSHHIAYLYNYAGVPSKTQARVRRIMDEFYKPTPDGLIGNEDCGQMSAWFVLSASGFYSTLPGEKRYDLGTPLFKEVVYNLENGKKFIVRAPAVSPKNIYIRSAKWNGRTQYWPYIVQEQIMAGGVLELDMTDKPTDNAFESVSVSSLYQETTAVPVVDGDRVFRSPTNITMRGSTWRNSTVRYTLDGSDPVPGSAAYSSPIAIDKTTTVKAAVFVANEIKSKIVEAVFHKRPNDWTVKLLSEYNSQYPGGGNDAIIDGLRGNQNFAAGEWQGYWGKPFEAVIDMQRPTRVSTVGGSFLQTTRSWIWMPSRIEFESSDDGVTFTKIAEIQSDVTDRDEKPQIREFISKLNSPVTARYIRIRAHNIGKIPSWHPGSGLDPWLFVDEVILR